MTKTSIWWVNQCKNGFNGKVAHLHQTRWQTHLQKQFTVLCINYRGLQSGKKKKLTWATWCFTHLISAQDFDFQFFSEFRATQYRNHQLTQGQTLTRSGAGVQSLFLFPTISISTILTDQMVANRRFKPASQMAFYTFSPSLKFCTISHQLRPYNPTHETTRVQEFRSKLFTMALWEVLKLAIS